MFRWLSLINEPLCSSTKVSCKVFFVINVLVVVVVLSSSSLARWNDRPVLSGHRTNRWPLPQWLKNSVPPSSLHHLHLLHRQQLNSIEDGSFENQNNGGGGEDLIQQNDLPMILDGYPQQDLQSQPEILTANNITDSINDEDASNFNPSTSVSSTGDNYDDRHCPRDREEAKGRGQSCLRKCNSHTDCLSSKRRCLCDGLCGWSCIRPDLNCEELPEIKNGRFILINENFFHSRAIYECLNGFVLSGTKERLCQGDGLWSNSAPRCHIKPLCGPLPFIPHSKHSELIGDEFELNTTVSYECFNGYESHGSSQAVCVYKNQTVFWEINLVCIRKNCSDPGQIENGYRKISGYVFTSSVNYYCNDGYILSGRALRYCQSDGHWGGELPICKPIKCPQPEDPINGRAFYVNYTFGSVVQYQCKTSYMLHGPANRTCQANREWSDQEPRCKIIDCGTPESFPNGYIEYRSTTIGSVLNFFCFDGMVFEGWNHNGTCTDDGTWKPYPFPRCQARCTIPTVKNGFVVLPPSFGLSLGNRKIMHGEPINVTCIENYELLHPSNSIFCNNGTWSQLPACVPARCKTLPDKPKNGFVVAPKTDHGMRALFRCQDGYRLEGPNMTWCHFGHWNRTTPFCYPIYCSFPGYIENGKIFLVGFMGMYDYRPYVKRVTNSRQIVYECDNGYFITKGPNGATCVDGQWSPPEFPQCERFFHPKLMRWNRSAQKIQISFNDTTMLSNPDAFQRDRQKTSRLASRKQSGKFVHRRQRRRKRHHPKPSCSRLPEKISMKISIVRLGNGNDTFPHGTRIRLVCDDGFVLTNPNRTIIKCAKGRWKPELPDCVPAPCMTPTVANARFWLKQYLLEPSELVKHGHQIELMCENGYQQQQPTSITRVTLQCSFGSWDSFTSQACLPKPCSLPPVSIGGKFILPAENIDSTTKQTHDYQTNPYLNNNNNINQIEHDQVVRFECLPGYRPNHTTMIADEYRCHFGQIRPNTPKCIQQTSFDSDSNQNSIHHRCRSPEKIENALLYFDQLLNQRLTLIGVAQLNDQSRSASHGTKVMSDSSNNDYRSSKNLPMMPFEYEHGTEIVFRCVTHSPMTEKFDDNEISTNQTLAKHTWLIRCEYGNWIGKSFKCDSTMVTEPEELAKEFPKDSINSLNRSCSLHQIDNKTNDSNIRFYLDDQVVSNERSIDDGQTIMVTCSDIGRYQLIGAKKIHCQNGEWFPQMGQKKPQCLALSQESNYTTDKPPTILFRNQLGPIAQTSDHRLMVYPGTILHLDCLWLRKYATPHWSWKSAQRQYLQYWPTDSSLEYRLTIFHAQESDSGVYTCQTPNQKVHSVEIKVQAIHCPNLNLTIMKSSNNNETLNNTSSLNKIESKEKDYANILKVVENNGNRLDSSIRFECPLGTTMLGPSRIRCLPSGRWSDPLPRCNVTECYDLITNLTLMVKTVNQTSEFNRRVTPAQIIEMKHAIGSRVIFTCPKGYGLHGGAHELECLINGLWSGSVPYCLEVQCGEPLTPKNGYIEGQSMNNDDRKPTQYFAGDIVQYACDDGYMVDGNPISICQENGRWSGPITQCKPACTYPGLMHASRLVSEVKFFYEINETIRFECIEGYLMSGNQAIKCIDSGQWTGSVPDCIPIESKNVPIN